MASVLRETKPGPWDESLRLLRATDRLAEDMQAQLTEMSEELQRRIQAGYEKKAARGRRKLLLGLF